MTQVFRNQDDCVHLGKDQVCTLDAIDLDWDIMECMQYEPKVGGTDGD